MLLLLPAMLLPAPARAAREVPPPGAEPPAFRSLPVTLVTDDAFRRLPLWRGRAKRVVEEGTADLLDLADLYLHIDAEAEWTPDSTHTTFTGILDELAGRYGGEPGLVVLLLGEAPAYDGDYLGYATLGRPYVVLAADEAPMMETTFRHELGHVFGIPHIPGRNVMAAKMEDRTRDFDTLSLDVLRATRNMGLHDMTPFTDCNLEILRDVYLAWLDIGTGDASLWLNLGIACRRERLPRDARLCLEAALRMDHLLGPAWYHLGKTRLDLGDEEGAIQALTRYLELEPEGRYRDDAERTLAPLPHGQ